MQTWDLLSVHAPNGTRDPLVLHSDDGARAVLIVLQPGQELGEHQVKENAWVSVIEGRVQVEAGGEQLELGAGGLMRFEANERHSVSSAEGARILMLLSPWPGDGHYPAD